jgi:uncharacterized membrane protein (DUF373 family)
MIKSERRKPEEQQHTDFFHPHHDPLIDWLHWIIRQAVRALAILMTLVILWGVGEVIVVMYRQLMTPPVLLLDHKDILTTFGSFLSVLIGIEIFWNITMYLRDDIIHVKLVLATALMAIARKVIVFDFQTIDAQYVWATASVVLAIGITYWLQSHRIR